VREGQEPFDVTVKRDTIKVKPIKYRLEGEIGYIRVSTFNEHTEKMLREAVLDIKKQLGGKLKGVILDLRNNPGGLFDQVLKCADLFLESGEIVSVRGRDLNQTQRFTATAGDLTGGLPVAVLINAGSASCSEILAGALQDNKRAIIMGNRSFGKGSVQVVLPSGGKQGGLVLTIARYYPPSGYAIQGNGVTPDVIINQAEVKVIEDKSRREENLHNALKPAEGALSKVDALKRERDRVIPLLEKKQQEEEERRKKASEEHKSDAKGKDKDKSKKDDDHKSPWAQPAKVPDSEKDYQLARALDMLKAYATYSRGETKK
jgi:carboxyl-terminal processing protease